MTRALCLFVVAVALLSLPMGLVAAPSVRLTDLENRSVDPFLASESHKAIVFLFASVECPVSNRYAPVVKRLYDTYASQGVAFWLIYPNPFDTPQAIEAHLAAFAYPVHALRDPKHELVKMVGAQVTPEAAVYDVARTLVYHGRIDDRYVSIGVERPAATRHDLADAIAATLEGRAVQEQSTQAVGCFIADFVE
jgi:hypothetical protein